MRNFINTTLLSIAVNSIVLAAETTEKNQNITPQELAERLNISAKIFIFDSSGKILLEAPDRISTWSGNKSNLDTGFESNWGSGGDFGEIHIHHRWTVKSDGSISVLIEEYASEVEDKKTGDFIKFENLLKKAEFTLENFAPVIWQVQNIKDKKVIVHFIAGLKEEKPEAIDISSLPISGVNVAIIDNKGHTWNKHNSNSIDNHYIGFKTHRGFVALSFLPFKGAKHAGTAFENEINLHFVDQDLEVTLISQSAFLPDGILGKVYAVYLPNFKTENFQKTSVYGSSREESLTKLIEAGVN
ncbi:MAG: hypothetical protein KBD78_15415 [Oligoflexales bacterium]|nr:hypothetical protein [Oligoflexales bacterium]